MFCITLYLFRYHIQLNVDNFETLTTVIYMSHVHDFKKSYLIKVMFLLMDTNAMELSYFILNTSTTLCYDITCRLQTKTWQIVSVLFFHVLNKDIAFHAIEVFVANRTYHPLSSLM